MRLFLLVLLFTTSVCAFGDNLVVSGGQSIESNNYNTPFGEYHNRSRTMGIRYEGQHYGIRIDHSFTGDDAGNTYLTGDAIFHFLKYGVAGVGIAIMHHPLRVYGSYMNFHAMLGIEDPHLFGKFGGAIYYDHWSNGHVHQIIGWDGIPDPPRNVISAAILIPIKW